MTVIINTDKYGAINFFTRSYFLPRVTRVKAKDTTEYELPPH